VPDTDQHLPAFSRRRFLEVATGLGVLAVTRRLWLPTSAWAEGPTSTGTGTTPEQVHLTWAFDAVNNPTNSMIVTWLQPQPSTKGFVVYAPASNPTGLTGAGTTTVNGAVNTQQGGNINGGATGSKPSPAAGSPSGTVPSGTFMGFTYTPLQGFELASQTTVVETRPLDLWRRGATLTRSPGGNT